MHPMVASQDFEAKVRIESPNRARAAVIVNVVAVAAVQQQNKRGVATRRVVVGGRNRRRSRSCCRSLGHSRRGTRSLNAQPR